MVTQDLWQDNHPKYFWQIQTKYSDEIWERAIQASLPTLELNSEPGVESNFLSNTVGEGQFGSKRYQLSFSKRLYYLLKPLLPRLLIEQLKTTNARNAQTDFLLRWPVEDRYVRFQWEIIHQLLNLTGERQLVFRHLWPNGKRFALVLTHDVETAQGLANVRRVADQEIELGFRSSFNFVAERYPLDYHLMDELRDQGFEIGVHGLKHDGNLFSSQARFMRRAERINHYLEEFNAVGFRSPLMHRHPEWMQALDIEYDLSFFDTDPYEPMPGGCMSIWPFTIGHFIELPYTLVQDSTLGYVLGETTPRLWLEKLEFIKKFHGMALLNTHPDYLIDSNIWVIYKEFLQTIKDQHNYWHALPREVARWWRKRSETPIGQESSDITLGTIYIQNDQIQIN